MKLPKLNIHAVVLALIAAPALAAPKMGEPVASFEMEFAQREPADVQRRVARLGQVFSGRELRLAESAAKLGRDQEASWHAPFADAPRLLVRHVAAVDELRILDDEVAQDLEPKGAIDREAALRLAGAYLKRLGEAGFIDPRHYDLKRADVGTHRIVGGEVSSKKLDYERITEYRITLRPALNGIELANAGVRLGVHVSGKLAGLRVGGVTVRTVAHGQTDLPAGRGQQHLRRVDDAAIDRALAKAFTRGAEPKQHWSTVMYVMPEGETRALVAPTRVHAFSEMHRADGESVSSRRRIVGFSIIDAGLPMFDYTPARDKSRAPEEPTRNR